MPDETSHDPRHTCELCGGPMCVTVLDPIYMYLHDIVHVHCIHKCNIHTRERTCTCICSCTCVTVVHTERECLRPRLTHMHRENSVLPRYPF